MKEKPIERNIWLPQCVSEGYIYRNDIKTYDALNDNFWKHLERLNGVLSENEKKRIAEAMGLSKVKNNKGRVKNAFNIMYVREGLTISKDDGTTLHVMFYDDKNKKNNVYEVVNQVAIDDDTKLTYNYLDVLGLENGLPRWWFELKSTDVSIESAKTQLEKYHTHSMYGLLNYVVVFGVSNDIYTRYMVNNEVFLKNTFWKWKDESNNDVNDAAAFVSSFLRPDIFHDIITNCVFVKYGKAKELTYHDEKLNELKSVFASKEVCNVILKGYQYRAYKAAYDANVKKRKNAVCWLHMGTGKTLISLMIFDSLKRAGRQVLLLVDRCDLNAQSFREYASFDPTIAGALGNSKENYKKLLDKKSFICTIQSFYAILEDEKRCKEITEKVIKGNVVFLQDEVHRTQGKMRLTIEKNFPDAKWCGFTGTPLLKEWQIKDEQKLTLDLFGLSDFTYTYQMQNALEDGETTKIRIEEPEINVVSSPFGSFPTMLSKAEIEEIKGMYEKSAPGIKDEDEVIHLKGIWKEYFTNTNRIKAIDANILTALPKKCIENPKTEELYFCAQLMVSDVNCVNLHLHWINEMQKKMGTNYRIAAVGIAGDNVEYTDPTDETKTIFKTDIYKAWVDHYNDMFGLTGKDAFDPSQYEKYEKDVVRRAENGEIDLIISATKLTTGYDNPLENTVFIDRFFSLQALLQAIARATRLFNQKEFANAVCYVPLKTTFDAALKLYNGSSDLSDHIAWEKYEVAVSVFKGRVSEVRALAPTWEYARDNIKDDEDKRDFIECFCKMYKQYRILQAYIEYEFDEKEFGITEEEISRYKGVIAGWRENASSDGTSGTFDGLDFEVIDDACFVEVDADYIRKLIPSIISIPGIAARKKRAEEIINLIKSSSNPYIVAQSAVLIRSVEEAVKCATIEEYEERIEKIVEEMKDNDIKEFADKNLIDATALIELVEKSIKYNNKNDISTFVNEQLKSRNSEPGIFKVKKELKDGLGKFLEIFRNKYTGCC